MVSDEIKIGDFVMNGKSLQKVIEIDLYSVIVLDLESNIVGESPYTNIHKVDITDITKWRIRENHVNCKV